MTRRIVDLNVLAFREISVVSANWPGFVKVAWAGIGLLGAAIMFVAIQGKWLGVATLGGFLVVSFLFVIEVRRLPALFNTIFVLAALINAAGWTWNLYERPGLYDETAHLFTMFAVTLAFGFVSYDNLMAGFYRRQLMFVVTLTCMGIAMAAMWEALEWSVDFLVPQDVVSGLFDTMTDILLGSAGALAAALINLRGLHERTRHAEDGG